MRASIASESKWDRLHGEGAKRRQERGDSGRRRAGARLCPHSHVNLVVHDTVNWEQSAAYHLDTHPAVRAFVKNHGLNFTIPYLHNGQPQDYVPDFVARLNLPGEEYLIAELKGADWDGLTGVKQQAAERWCAAINAGEFGHWRYRLAMKVGELVAELDSVVAAAG